MPHTVTSCIRGFQRRGHDAVGWCRRSRTTQGGVGLWRGPAAAGACESYCHLGRTWRASPPSTLLESGWHLVSHPERLRRLCRCRGFRVDTCPWACSARLARQRWLLEVFGLSGEMWQVGRALRPGCAVGGLTGARRVCGAEGRNLAVEAGGGDPFVKLKLGDQEVHPISRSPHARSPFDSCHWMLCLSRLHLSALRRGRPPPHTTVLVLPYGSQLCSIRRSIRRSSPSAMSNICTVKLTTLTRRPHGLG
jgi:hypothetical protein